MSHILGQKDILKIVYYYGHISYISLDISLLLVSCNHQRSVIILLF
jgi:hypothetical protein